ncbi:MAG: hypothetical protein COZ16_12265 [Flavobacteriaceae bacterium CG_4_10_14_3_um_filter_31_253]|nr:MAG: hypothetical protein COZ16_12265 [Flavobacteriaceae bacterium CG_4_10_14_3_um_filter_31_253]
MELNFTDFLQKINLRELLPRGYAKVAASKFECSPEKIYSISSGRTQDNKILLYLLEIAEEEYKIRIEIEQKLTKLENAINTPLSVSIS